MANPSNISRPSEPIDPSDLGRTKTQSRGDVYPYDKPISYGKKSGTAWDRISDSLDRADCGPQASQMAPVGLGNRETMGEDGVDAIELEMDALKLDFRNSYDAAQPTTDEMGSPDLFALLTQLDPEFSAETFAPEDEDEMRSIYGLWADRMSGHEE